MKILNKGIVLLVAVCAATHIASASNSGPPSKPPNPDGMSIEEPSSNAITTEKPSKDEKIVSTIIEDAQDDPNAPPPVYALSKNIKSFMTSGSQLYKTHYGIYVVKMTYPLLKNESEAALAVPSPLRFGISGLVNLGNTCYFNSFMQALSHSLGIVRALAMDLNKIPRNSLAYKIVTLLLDMGAISPQKANERIVFDTQFLMPDIVKSSNGRFTAGIQQDAAELAILVLDVLETAYKKHSNIQSLYSFETQQKLTCKVAACGKVQYTKPEPNTILMIPLPNNTKESLNLQNLIDKYIASTNRVDSFKMSCNHDDPTGVYLYSNSSEYLIVNLKRFGNVGQGHLDKISTPVVAPVRGLIFNGQAYNLTSTVDHIGSSMNGGHYVARVKQPGTLSFFRFSDDTVSDKDCDVTGASSSNYIFIYRRVNLNVGNSHIHNQADEAMKNGKTVETIEMEAEKPGNQNKKKPSDDSDSSDDMIGEINIIS